MQKYTPFTDDLQIALGRCQARFKCAVAVVLVVALVAVCVTLWQIGRAKPLVLEESTKELLLKQASVDRKFKTWCDDVEAFAGNIARQSLVQLSVSSYAAMSKEARAALNQKEGGYDEDKALMAYLRDMFATFAKSHDMEEGLLVMADGDILLGASRTPAFSEAWKGLLQRVLATHTFQYGSFHSYEGKAYINVGVPIFPAVDGEGAKPIGALIMALPLNSLFRDLLTPPADNRGIRRMALVQLERKDGGTLCIGVESRGNVFLVHREFLQKEIVLKELSLSEDQMQREDGQNYYVMFFPSKTGLDAHVCAMVPEGVMDQAIESRRYMTLVCLSVGIAFLALVLLLASLLRDRAVRALVNRRIAEQKAILDSINASIQDGMVLLDKNGRIIYMNEHFFTAEGKARWVTLHLAEVLERESADKILDCMRNVLESGAESSLEMQYTDGKLYRVTIYPGQESEGLSSKVSLGCVAFFRDITEFRKKARESQQRTQKILDVFSTIVESVDAGLRGHTEKVMAIIEVLDPLLRFSREELETLRIAARLFQVGKLFVPRHLLNKRGKLTPEEYAQVSKAPEAAYELLYSLNFGLPVAETVYEMGERVDGRGPRGLKGEEILFTARVLSAVNAFCSMISPRSYRKALSVETALEQLRKDAGFDPEVVEALCAIPVKDFQTIVRKCTGEGDSFQNAMALWDQMDPAARDSGN